MSIKSRFDGFRIEFPKHHKISKRLRLIGIYLRNQSRGKSGACSYTIQRLANRNTGLVHGTWKVTKAGTVSFRGYCTEGFDIEFLYGKLTIGRYLNRPVDLYCFSRKDAVIAFTKLIDNTFPALSPNLKLDQPVHA